MRSNIDQSRLDRTRQRGTTFTTVEQVLSGDYVMGTESAQFHFFNGGAADRNVRLPDIVSGGGQYIAIANTGATNDLLVLDSGGVLQVTITPSELAFLLSAPSGWRYIVNSISQVPSTRDIIAGAGLTGGGDLSADRTLDVVGSTSIIVGANDVQRAALTGDVTAAQDSNTTVIAADAVDNTKLANMPSHRVKGNSTGGAGDPEDLIPTNTGTITFDWSVPGQLRLYRGALTGDVTAGLDVAATTIANNAVNNAKMADMDAARVKGRAVGAGTGDPTDLTPTQLSSLIAADSGGGTSNFLRADGGWKTPLFTLPKGRLTLTSGAPVSSSVTGATTIYYAPYQGNMVPIYDGTEFQERTFTELSQALSDATKSPAATIAEACYDMFVWDDAGTLRCTRGPAWNNSISGTAIVSVASPAVVTWNAHGLHAGCAVVFTGAGLPTGIVAGTTYYVGKGTTANTFNVTNSQALAFAGTVINTSGTSTGVQTATNNDTKRGTGAGTSELTRVNGILVNANAITNGPAANRGTYVGTIRTTAANQLEMQFTSAGSGGTDPFMCVWNYYNRVEAAPYMLDNGVTYTYGAGGGPLRIARASASNKINFVNGMVEDAAHAILNELLQTPAIAGDFVSSSIGLNDIVITNNAQALYTNGPANGVQLQISANLVTNLPLGWSFIASLDAAGNTNNSTYYGAGLMVKFPM